jgi:hypothetical protein
MGCEMVELGGSDRCANTHPTLTTSNPNQEGHVMATADSTVIYKEIPGFPGYRIGNDGSLWTCKNAKWGFRDTWKRLRPYTDNSGHLQVVLMSDAKKKKNFFVHVLVLNAFVGPRPKGFDACHGNGDPADNRLENLRWDTRAANIEDSKRHGTFCVGEKNGHCRLTEDQVREIREIHASGQMGYKRIAKKFGVSFSAVVHICHRINWKHIS